jgi:hypothetical protein
MKYFDIYVTSILMVKIVFVILVVYRLYVKSKKTQDKKLLETLEFWKSRVEFLFISLMCILLIYLFNPRANRINIIDSNTKLLLYLFGFVLLLTESWSDFIHKSLFLKKNNLFWHKLAEIFHSQRCNLHTFSLSQISC